LLSKYLLLNFFFFQISDSKDDIKMRIIESETYGLLIAELDKRVLNRSLSKIKNRKNYFIEQGYNLFNNITKENVLQLKVKTNNFNNNNNNNNNIFFIINTSNFNSHQCMLEFLSSLLNFAIIFCVNSNLRMSKW